jgi:hypothetical protein
MKSKVINPDNDGDVGDHQDCKQGQDEEPPNLVVFLNYVSLIDANPMD